MAEQRTNDRLSKIITKGGDKGKTSIGGGTRLHKFDPRITAIGDVDELNSSLGVFLAELKEQANTAVYTDEILSIQHDLFNLGGELAMPGYELVTEEALAFLENKAAEMNDSLEPLKEFILPSGSKAVSFAHMSRSICRRAERQVVLLSHETASDEEHQIRPILLKYLNRLSDYLFILARTLGKLDGQEEIMWQR